MIQRVLIPVALTCVVTGSLFADDLTEQLLNEHGVNGPLSSGATQPSATVDRLAPLDLPEYRQDALTTILAARLPELVGTQRVGALQLLSRLRRSSRATQLLLAVLADPAEPIASRCVAAEALVARHEPRALLPLLDALACGDPALTQLAAALLAPQADDPRVMSRMRTLLADPRPQVRRGAVEILAHGCLPASRGLLLRMVEDTDARVKAAALRAAGRRTMGEALPALTAALTSSDLDQQLAAAAGLTRLGTLAAPACATAHRLLDTPETPPLLAAGLLELLAAAAPAATETAARLAEFAQAEDPAVRHAVWVARMHIARHQQAGESR
jgi:hypothetical protein